MKQKLLKTLSLLLCTSLCVSLLACGKNDVSDLDALSDSAVGNITIEPQTSETEISSMNDTKTVYPITLTDALGREVVIEKEPQSIVSGYYITSSILIALGVKDKIVGIEDKADKRNIYALSTPKLCELPNVGTVKQIDIEACATLMPDLLVAPAKIKEQIPALEELGITTLTVNPEDSKQLLESIDILGRAVNAPQNAFLLKEYIANQLAILSNALQDVTDREYVYLGGNSSFLSTAGPAMFQNTLINWAGAYNVAYSIEDTYWAEVSYEQILAWNPTVIVLAANAAYTVEDILNDSALSEVDAVKSGKVFQIPSYIEAWDSPVPSAILGSLWLAAKLYPEHYSMEEFEATKADFYSTFYSLYDLPAEETER